MKEEIVNKIANSGLVNIDLEDWYPDGKRMHIDISVWLDGGFVLREKNFRETLAQHDWPQYKDAYVSVSCGTDAIVPKWAWLLIGAALTNQAKKTVYGNQEQLESLLFEQLIHNLDVEPYRDQRVILKGCSNLPVPTHAYVLLAQKLQPVVRSLMYGEACSTVPVFKNKK